MAIEGSKTPFHLSCAKGSEKMILKLIAILGINDARKLILTPEITLELNPLYLAWRYNQ